MSSISGSPATGAKTRGGPSRLGSSIAFEWTKLTSVRSTWWNVTISSVVTIALGLLLGGSMKASADNGYDVAMPAPHVAFQSLIAAQFLVMVMATLFIASEYTSGSIKTTLQSVPVRARMLFGKVAVIAAIGLVIGVVQSTIGTAAIALLAGDYSSFTATELSLTILGSAVDFALLGITALGLATAFRSATGTIIATVGLFGLPRIVPIFNIEWLTDFSQYFPTEAGTVLGLQTTAPYGWSTATLVLLAWAATALTAGYAVLHIRDA
ncbi:ABC transporter [Planotetraspora thailandica]|uniref:ABC transporter n=1 Tax=Planotetraspora thailandica TaxID=487172 RepID=A0A8J3V4A5_9ACTN|nr:ABC transporter permease [Planotetraspora thailandica]GII57504.1 ABC transporter [Planotetraspora thailandica]